MNKNNEWVGFSIDLVEQARGARAQKKLGKTIKVEKKESAPPTRIPLLSVQLGRPHRRDHDGHAGAPPERRLQPDVLPHGRPVPRQEGQPDHSLKDVAGKRVAAQQGSTNAKFLRENVRNVQLREFPDQPAAFQALLQGQVDAYTNDGIQLAGLKAKAPNPDTGGRGRLLLREPYGMAMRKGDTDFKAVVDAGLRKLIKSGKYFELYDKWFGPKGEVPYPMTAEVKKFMRTRSEVARGRPRGRELPVQLERALERPVGSLAAPGPHHHARDLGAGVGARHRARHRLRARSAPCRYRPLRALATCYVEFFRNVPLLVWMFFWYFGVPPLLPRGVQDWLFNHGAEFWAGMFALGVYHGARFSEVIRSGIQAIPRTQFEASLAIGPHDVPGLPPDHPAHRAAAHRAARHQRVAEPAEELVGGAHHQRGGADLPDAADRDVHRQGHRGADGGHR